MSTKPSAKEQAGFTLLELMVALAVFALAALALVRVMGMTVRTSGDLAARSTARLVLQNRAVEIESDPAPPTLGTASGTVENGGQRWTWSQTVSLTANSGVAKIDLSVIGPGLVRPASLTIVKGLRPDAPVVSISTGSQTDGEAQP